MRIKKGDTIKKIAGKDRGKEGKLIRVLPREGKIVVEKMNIVQKHSKPRRQGSESKHGSAAWNASCA